MAPAVYMLVEFSVLEYCSIYKPDLGGSLYVIFLQGLFRLSDTCRSLHEFSHMDHFPKSGHLCIPVIFKGIVIIMQSIIPTTCL